jgi:hypothetical protein
VEGVFGKTFNHPLNLPPPPPTKTLQSPLGTIFPSYKNCLNLCILFSSSLVSDKNGISIFSDF